MLQSGRADWIGKIRCSTQLLWVAMSGQLDDLLKCLDLEPVGAAGFRGHCLDTGWRRVFGGLVVAQALVAAQRTVEAWPPHSLHGYFILPGDPALPILYEVDILRDGKSFATRRCNALQNGHAIFSLIASFQKDEPGLDHQLPMPQVALPEDLLSEAEIEARYRHLLPEAARHWFDANKHPIETRFVDLSRFLDRKPRPPVQYIWFRTAGALPDDQALHRALLAYMSDLTLLDTALVAHGRTIFDADLQVASLDHALWFHRPFRADDWLLYAQDSPNSSGARGLTRGLIYARDGRLIASVAQEGLIRQRVKEA
jgi:acyl-CoA thioesterase II